MMQPNLVQLAQSGDANAIAILMNSTLHAIGVTARVVVKEDDLYILLESEHVLAQNSCTEFIRRGIARLGMAWLSSAVIYSRIVGEPAPLWVQKIELTDTEFINPFVLAPGTMLDSEGGALRRLPTPIPRRVRLFDLLLLGFPLLVVVTSIQIWSRYLSNGWYAPSATAPSQVDPQAANPSKTTTSAKPDAIEAAMRQASGAVQQGKTAKTRVEWRQAADQWGKAIALLESVSASHPKAAMAQQKLEEYQRNLAFVAKDHLSLSGMELKKTIAGGISPKSVVYSGDDLFFAQNMMYSHTITVYDREYQLVKTISDGVKLSDFGYSQYKGSQQGAPVEAAFSHDGKTAWVSNYEMYGTGFSSSADDTCSPSSNNDPSFLYRIGTGTLKVEQVVKVGAVPKFVATTPSDRYVLVSNWCSWDVSVVDTHKNKEIRRIQLGPYPRGIAIDRKSEKAYVAVMGSYDIAVINLKDFSVKWLKDIGHSPRHLNIDPEGKYLYATLNGEGQVAKIDLSTGTVVSKIATGEAPRSMAISADGQFLYVVNYNSDSVSKVRTRDMKVVQTVSVNPAPIGITYDAKTHQVWVACYSGSILVFQD
ncbi:YncE family protein [Kovacikia minuta CCNUW1]|uniref:beta-propeller fold lactonase family protein n=1 Tax=Kovacikia minuta TaxID=2931930 RepID=UPI001CC9D1A4|nr:YncE family protein [Kovacikia minuta]UBF26956.1 YncE family protein [Kovacikia minuta CCNUW1]